MISVLKPFYITKQCYLGDIWNSNLYNDCGCPCLIGWKSNLLQPTSDQLPTVRNVLSKVAKNISFQIKTLLVMFYKHNKHILVPIFLCNFKHFLKAENSEDSLASSCVRVLYGLSLISELYTRTGQTVFTIFCFQKMFKITKLVPQCFMLPIEHYW